MKISMFTNTYLPHVGGVARSVTTFAEDLRNRGHRVQIIAPTFKNLKKGSEEDVVRVPAIQNFNGSDFSVRIPLPGLIRDAVEAFDPDIIHSHHPFLLGDAALRIARSASLPLVFTHHTLYEQYTHYVPLDSKQLKRFVINLATGYANLCNQVIAPSTAVEKLLRERGVQSNITVLPTGIDIAFFEAGDGRRFRREHDIPEDAAVIGHVGRLAKEKNLPYLAEAIALVLQGNRNVRFLVAGSGDAENALKRILSECHAEKQLVMMGNMIGAQLADCYAAMDLFVFASLSETQGLVLAEAMAAATPVIALSASGVNDVIRDGRNGRCLPADASIDLFSKTVTNALNNLEQLHSWRLHARETALAFSRDKAAERLIQLYDRLLASQQHPHTDEIDLIDSVVLLIQAEWDLIQEKAAAAIESFT